MEAEAVKTRVTLFKCIIQNCVYNSNVISHFVLHVSHCSSASRTAARFVCVCVCGLISGHHLIHGNAEATGKGWTKQQKHLELQQWPRGQHQQGAAQYLASSAAVGDVDSNCWYLLKLEFVVVQANTL